MSLYEFRPITEFPELEEGELFSKTVLLFGSDDLNYADLGYYDFKLNEWVYFGGLEMNLICWRYIEKPNEIWLKIK